MSPPNAGADLGAGLAPAQDVIDEALMAAGEDCIVLLEEASQVDVRFANNTTTTNGVRRERRVSVICFDERDGKTAVGVASHAGTVDVAELVHGARQDAAGAAPAEDAAPLVLGSEGPGYEEGPVATDPGILAPLLRSLAKAFDRAEQAGRVLAGFAEHGVTTLYLGSSTGLRRRHVQPTGALHLVGRSTDGRRSAWAGAGTADFSDTNLDDLEARVGERLAWAETQHELPAGRYEVILPPEAVADMMVALAEAAGGRLAEEGRTVFSGPGGGTRLGEQLSPLPFTLRSDPHDRALACADFLATSASTSDVSVFDNGFGLGPTAWLSEGRLAHLRYPRALAERSGVEPAGPIDNLILELPGSGGTTADLVGRTERGLLLTCLWYIREVDPATLLLTGLTRDGVFLVEDGSVIGAVNNFRFNESPVDLLARANEAGESVRALGREFGEWVNRTRMPPLRIPDFNMSSVSQAT